MVQRKNGNRKGNNSNGNEARWACCKCKFKGIYTYYNHCTRTTCKGCNKPKAQVCSPTTNFAERQVEAQRKAEQAQRAKASKGNSNSKGKQGNQDQQAGEDLRKALDEALKRVSTLEAQVGTNQGKAKDEAPTEKQANDAKIKGLERKKKDLLGLNEQQVESIYGSKQALDAVIEQINKEKDDLLAVNRGLQPIKVQHARCSGFVDKLQDELDAMLDEKISMLETFWALEDSIRKKEVFLGQKRAELAGLAEKVAAEDALNPTVKEMDVENEENEFKDVDAEEKKIVKFVFDQLNETNLPNILESKGAIQADFAKISSALGKFSALLQVKEAPPSTAKQEASKQPGATEQPPGSKQEATAGASASASKPTAPSPDGGNAVSMDWDEEWLAVAAKIPGFNDLSAEDRDSRKRVWVETQERKKRPAKGADRFKPYAS